MNTRNYSEYQRGVSLVEILVAAAIGIVILGVMSALYLSNRKVFQYQESYSRLQESGRYASDVLGRELRNTAYLDCGGMSSMTNIVANNTTTWWLNTDRMIWGYDSGAALPAELQSTSAIPVSDSDVIVIKYRAVANESTITDHDLGNKTFTVGANHLFQKGTVLMASDCSRTSVFRMSNDNTSGGITTVKYATGLAGLDNTATSLSSTKYTAGGFIAPMVTNAYYVLQSDDPGFAAGTNPTPNPCPSTDPAFIRRVLAVRSLAGSTTGETIAARPVVCDVQSMQLRYGVDNDGDLSADQFMTATAVGTDPLMWQKVVSVRIEFLVVNPKTNTTDSDTRYCLDYNGGSSPGTCPASLTGASYTYMWPGQGKRSAKVFSTTFGFRNRAS